MIGPMPSKWRIEIESWLKTIEVTGLVLDIGGAEKPVRGRTKTWDVENYTVADKHEYIENGKVMREESVVWDFNEQGLVGGIHRSYDHVFCLETLMYAKRPYDLLDTVLMVSDRNVYISNPLEAYGETKPEGADMVRLFPNWFERILEDRGFEIIEMKVVYPSNRANIAFNEARQAEGYKMITNHRSGVLIHAKKL